MYQSLYRKYRPSTFDEVVGQDIIIKTIKNEINNNKLSHAYIFSGPRGTGKTSTAKIIAKTINCENPINLIPCNNCVNCTLYNNKQITDIIEIDAASNNGVDEIRELRNNVNLVPASGKYKVYIIDEVHMLTIGAFNALLKTLEEPPSHVIFILATTEIHKIPNTILSRCQKFDFNKISVNKIKERLDYIIKQEKIKIDDEAIIEIARLADGGMRDALSILDQVVAYSDSKITIDNIHEINGTIPQYELKELVENIINNNYNEIFEVIDKYDNNGKNFVKLAEEVINFYRNILLSINAKEYLEKNISYSEIYEELQNKITEQEIIYNIKYFNEAIPEMKKSNNPKLLFETVIIRILNKDKKNNNQSKAEKVIESVIPTKTKIEKPKEEEIIELNKNIDYEFLEKLENIRINNTLCNFDKKEYLIVKNKIEEIRVMLMNPKYSAIASLVLDGELKAYGNNILIFVFKNDRNSKLFNEQILEIEDLFNEVYKNPYKVIATNTSKWNKIKEEFNSKKKKYELIEEPSLDSIKKKVNNPIDSEFSDIIEYI